MVPGQKPERAIPTPNTRPPARFPARYVVGIGTSTAGSNARTTRIPMAAVTRAVRRNSNNGNPRRGGPFVVRRPSRVAPREEDERPRDPAGEHPRHEDERGRREDGSPGEGQARGAPARQAASDLREQGDR